MQTLTPEQAREIMHVVSYGGGVNSTALLIGLLERNCRPDVILFADTGGEFPDVYPTVEKFSAWLVERGFPAIVTVRYERETLEQNCLRMGMLPSLAYGRRGCSQKFKIQPQEKYLNNHPKAQAVWKSGGKVIKAIGYDAGESYRAKITDDEKYAYVYPLISWGWGRAKCEEVIHKNKLCANKSACFFCPASRKGEVLAMKQHYPDLLARAVEMELTAAENLETVKGLGGRWAWGDLIEADESQQKLFDDNRAERGCMCHD